MDNKEAIQWLQQIKDKYIHGGDSDFDTKRKEAIDYAIQKLSKFSVEIIARGTCARCGKPIDGNSIFLCSDCIDNDAPQID